MNLWPVEHFFLIFFSLFVQISTDPDKKWEKKCSTGQRFICTEVTSYKIHILAKLDYFPLFFIALSCCLFYLCPDEKLRRKRGTVAA